MVLVLTASCGRTELLRGAAADPTADAGVPPPCVPGVRQLTRAHATVLFVIDRSASMGFPFGRTTRWAALIAALSRSLPAVDSSIALGAYVFPVASFGSCQPPSSVDLAPAVGNVRSLLELLRAHGPNGATPTAEALQQAAQALRERPGVGRALVLATDGAPGCNPALDPRRCTCAGPNGCDSALECLDDARTVQRLAEITRSGIPTWVLGLQDRTDLTLVEVLDRLAVAGGRPRLAVPRYYAATDEPELESALRSIRDQVDGCTFVTDSVPTADASITVMLDGRTIAADTLDGWTWTDATRGELSFVGPACEIAARAKVVSVSIGCGPASH